MTFYGRRSKYQIKSTPAERVLAWLVRKLSGGRLKLRTYPLPTSERLKAGFFRGTEWPCTFTVTAHTTKAMYLHHGEEARVDVFPKSRWRCDYYWPRNNG